MAFPRPVIQVGTGGLLGLLGIQNNAQNPPHFGELVAPTFDLQDWYLRAQQEWVTPEVSANIPNGASGGFAVGFFTVPKDQWWYVHHYSAQVNCGAGDSVAQCALGIRGGGTSTVHLVSPMEKAFIASSVNALWAPHSFWVPPNGDIGMFVGTAVSVGPAVAFGRIVITRVRS
jgi:hypothetical protein